MNYDPVTRIISFAVNYNDEQFNPMDMNSFTFKMTHVQFMNRFNSIVKMSDEMQLSFADDSIELDPDFDHFYDFDDFVSMTSFFVNNAPVIAEIHNNEIFAILQSDQKTMVHQIFDALLLRELRNIV